MQPFASLDYQKMLGAQGRFAVLVTVAGQTLFMRPRGKREAEVWTTDEWVRGAPGRGVHVAWRGGSVMAEGGRVSVGIDERGSIILYRHRPQALGR